MKSINFERLWGIVIAQFPLGIYSMHGPQHWKQVEKNGLMLAKETKADEIIIKLFSLFHDSRRKNENIDCWHGLRGYELAKSMKGIHFDLPDLSFKILMDACIYHPCGWQSSDITTATCWDADRLDLPRVGIIPNPDKMGTADGKIRAAQYEISWRGDNG